MSTFPEEFLMPGDSVVADLSIRSDLARAAATLEGISNILSGALTVPLIRADELTRELEDRIERDLSARKRVVQREVERIEDRILSDIESRLAGVAATLYNYDQSATPENIILGRQQQVEEQPDSPTAPAAGSSEGVFPQGESGTISLGGTGEVPEAGAVSPQIPLEPSQPVPPTTSPETPRIGFGDGHVWYIRRDPVTDRCFCQRWPRGQPPPDDALAGPYEFQESCVRELERVCPPPTVYWAVLDRRTGRCNCVAGRLGDPTPPDTIGGPFDNEDLCRVFIASHLSCRRPPSGEEEYDWYVVRNPDGTCTCTRVPRGDPAPPSTVSGPYATEELCRRALPSYCPPTVGGICDAPMQCDPPGVITLDPYGLCFFYVRPINRCQVEYIRCQLPRGMCYPPPRPGYDIYGPFPACPATLPPEAAEFYLRQKFGSGNGVLCPGEGGTNGIISPPPTQEQIEEEERKRRLGESCIVATTAPTCPTEFTWIEQEEEKVPRTFCGRVSMIDVVRLNPYLSKCVSYPTGINVED